MNKVIKLKTLLIAILSTILCVCAVMFVNVTRTYADDEITLTMDIGAYLKVSDGNGLRMRVKLNEAAYAYLQGSEDVKLYFEIKQNGVKLTDLEADKTKIYIDKKDGSYCSNCLLGYNAVSTNRETDYRVLAYLKDGDGEPVYASFDSESQITKNLYNVANKALLDDNLDDTMIEDLNDNYAFMGTEDYPFVLNTTEEYDVLVERSTTYNPQKVVIGENVDTSYGAISGDSVALFYTVTFKSEDGTVLYTEIVEEGETPTYNETPDRDDETHDYDFLGWDKEIVAVTASTTYTAQFELKISTAAQLSAFAADPTNIGKVKLMNDIVLGTDRTVDANLIGKDTDDSSTYFTGTFDGQGYTIYNGIYIGNGLFTNLSSTAVVKNVAFKGAKLYSYELCNDTITIGGRSVNHRNTSIIGYYVYGTVDNVLIDVVVQPVLRYTTSLTDGRWGSAIGAWTANSTEVSNVVVYWRVISSVYGANHTYADKAPGAMHVLINTEAGGAKKGTYSNVVVFRNTTSRLYDMVDGITSDVYYYNDDTDLTTCATADLASKGFNDYWFFESNKAVFKDDTMLFISTADQLRAFSSDPTGYTWVILTDDIVLGTDRTVDANLIGKDTDDTSTYFTGTFDGKGHTIYNGIYIGNGLFTNLSSTAVVKNVAFKNAKLYSYELCSSTITIGGRSVNHRNTSIIGYYVYGTIDNVLLDVVVQPVLRYTSSLTDGRWGSAIGAYTADTTNVSNVVVYWRIYSSVYGANHTYADKAPGAMHVLINTEAGGAKKGTYSNVVVFRNTTSRLYDTVDGITSDVYYYKNDTDLTTCATADLASKGFNDYWDFTGDKAVMVG